MLFNSKYRWVGGQASSIQLVGRKRRGRLDMGYESWGQKVQCEMLEYFEVARDIDIIYGMTLTACVLTFHALARGKLTTYISNFY